MHWLSFVLGILAGWLIEWLIDIFYWRPRYRSCVADLAAVRSQYGADLAAARATFDKELDALRADRSEKAALRDALAAANGRVAELVEELHLVRGQIATDATVRTTFAAGAASASADSAGGSGVAPEAPQAGPPSFEASEPGAVDALAFSARSTIAAGDDLKVIEGIGPTIDRLLQDSGIGTFAQLATTSVPALRAVLTAAGARFRVADPTTWPDQARLAAAGDWEGLKVLQATLKAGRVHQ